MLSEQQDSAEAGRGTERSREREDSHDEDGSGFKGKGGNGQTQAKTKDVSHVPCKFFRLNQCSAGTACPFSHHILEPGQQKEVCQWFLKGNCKFAHKCALAHILPGQPMSMDRKNKKAAHQAAAVAGGVSNPANVKTDRRRAVGGKEESLRVGLGRGLGKTSAPIPISKATISPSAPAPPLRDTDFPVGLPDEFTQATEKQTGEEKTGTSPSDAFSYEEKTPAPRPPPELAPSTSTSPTKKETQQMGGTLPVSKPTPPRGFLRQNGSADFGFGPIGSPPLSSPTPNPQPNPQSMHRVNGFSPSTSPTPTGTFGPLPSTSTFSAPNSKSVYMSYSLDRDAAASTQIKASGAAAAPSNFGGAMSLGGIRGWDIMGSPALGVVQDDDDLEEFLPSSLNELLTDEEKKRRLSRTGGQRPIMDAQMSHHRYSRSVPAASLIDNVKNLWNDNTADIQVSAGPSPSFLGTSNVSTGFLPHRPGTGRTFSDVTTGLSATTLGFNGSGSPSSVAGLFMNRTIPSPLTAVPSQQPGGQQPRPIPGTADPVFNGNPLSPTARALQEHAPGQSLPQGLAAGLSRIHIRPPIPLGTSASPHQGLGIPSGSPAPRGSLSSTDFSGNGFGPLGSPPGLSRDDRFLLMGSRTGPINSPTGNAGSSMSNSSAALGIGLRRQWGPSQTLSSPLAGPVLTHDDDEMFAME